MKSLFASLLALIFITGSIVSNDPTLDQLCLNPAYAHMHSNACAGAVNPSNYNRHTNN